MTDLVLRPPVSIPEVTVGWTEGPPSSSRDFTELNRQIQRDGFAMRIGTGSEGLPYAYTVGLTSFGLPELITYCRDDGQLHSFQRLLKSLVPGSLEPGITVRLDRLDGLPVQVRSEVASLLSDATGMYGASGFSALQIYWIIGLENRDPKCDEIRFLARQPYLGPGTLQDLLA